MIAKLILITLPLLSLYRHMERNGQHQKKEYNSARYLKFVVLLYVLYYFSGIFNINL